MMNFGQYIMETEKEKTEITYESGKRIVAEYIERMNASKEYLLDRLKYDYGSEDFNRDAAVRFIRTWDIIMNDLTPVQRNLFVAFSAFDRKADDCIKLFNASNVYSLRQMVYVIQKKIVKVYKEKYDDKCNI